MLFFIFSSFIRPNRPEGVLRFSVECQKEPETGLYDALFIIAIIFLMLKAVAKKAKSMVTLSLPK